MRRPRHRGGRVRRAIARLLALGRCGHRGRRVGGCGIARRELPRRVHAGPLDVTDASSWQELLGSGVERFRADSDILVNNGRIAASTSATRPAEGFGRRGGSTCLGAFLIQAALPPPPGGGWRRRRKPRCPRRR